MNEESSEKARFVENIRDDVGELVEDLWVTITNKWGEDLSEEEMMNLFGALGIVAGMAMVECSMAGPVFPYQLQGMLNDYTYQSYYAGKYGINFQEVEYSVANPH